MDASHLASPAWSALKYLAVGFLCLLWQYCTFISLCSPADDSPNSLNGDGGFGTPTPFAGASRPCSDGDKRFIVNRAPTSPGILLAHILLASHNNKGRSRWRYCFLDPLPSSNTTKKPNTTKALERAQGLRPP